MRNDYINWLTEQKYSDGTRTAQLYRVQKVEECYGNLDEHFQNGTLQSIIDDLEYSTKDERQNKPNPSKIQFEGNIRNNLQSYKNAVVRYRKFLMDDGFKAESVRSEAINDISDTPQTSQESTQQRFTLERDMQVALRQNIALLDSGLRIIDDGVERAVDSGLIDITCEDDNGIVVIELKAGKADSRAIGQILGYMGDLQEEESAKQVRGILVAHDFDRRAKAAARVVPTLKLMNYSIEFKFTENS
ncbi:endonuclease NucS domain-containing protein [Parapusillimonas sp. JC17]|uniref:endonuclease NucS domain-containing protein n=1 Tax=Parapusillimonas sp. JC17 TaxID=3445768 RepID=UPI003F9FE56C